MDFETDVIFLQSEAKGQFVFKLRSYLVPCWGWITSLIGDSDFWMLAPVAPPVAAKRLCWMFCLKNLAMSSFWDVGGGRGGMKFGGLNHGNIWTKKKHYMNLT